jgi:hypothetical protein
MTEPRPHRAGLGLPSAVIIRSDPPPSTRQRELFEAAQLALSDRDWNPSEQEVWQEWNINPARHGPERPVRLPTFVKSTIKYDELGRSALEGAEVEVNEGRRKRARQEGEVGDTGEWYRSIASRTTSVRPKEESRGENTSNDVIDLSLDEEIVSPSCPNPDDTMPAMRDTKPDLSLPVKAGSPMTEPTNMRTPSDDQPLRVHRSEWFIRRALLAQNRSSPSANPSSAGPSSISSMLNIGPTQIRTAPAHYVLGPDNKGYELLQTRHGWEGGGLGRPSNWEERDQAHNAPGPSRQRTPPSVELDTNGEPVVDLTIDSEAEEDDELDIPTIRQGGPGRTAPIATSLKLDRLGLGHQRNTKAARDAEKKVTHTIEEIRRVQQRSRYPPPKQGIELGKKGKVRWKERDRKDREERKHLMRLLNS